MGKQGEEETSVRLSYFGYRRKKTVTVQPNTNYVIARRGFAHRPSWAQTGSNLALDIKKRDCFAPPFLGTDVKRPRNDVPEQ